MMNITDLFNDPASPAGMTVRQVTDDPESAFLVYPDKPCFLVDGHRLVIHTSTGLAICDLENGGALRPVLEDEEKRGVRVTFDGRYCFYKNPVEEGDTSLTIHRLDFETMQADEVFHAEGSLPGTHSPVSKFGLATISSDNNRIASTVFMGDGTAETAAYGIVSLDLARGEWSHVAQAPDFVNTHLQYCRSTDPVASRDLLLQHNHGAQLDVNGKTERGLGPPSDGGVDLHIVADDGSNWRDLPFGRDGVESCIGHQVWRGNSDSVATVTLQNLDTSYGWAEGSRQEVVAGWSAPADKNQPHRGRLNPGTRRLLLSEGFTDPRFCHLCCDDSGLNWVFDTFPVFDGQRAGMLLYAGSAPDENSPAKIQYLLNTGITFKFGSQYHAHPILSPDGSKILFNSNISGKPQVYMVDVGS